MVGWRAQLAQAWLGGGTGARASEEDDDELALLMGSGSQGDDESMDDEEEDGGDGGEDGADGNASPRGTKGRDTCAPPLPDLFSSSEELFDPTSLSGSAQY